MDQFAMRSMDEQKLFFDDAAQKSVFRSLKLLPRERVMREMEQDYAAMKEMFYGDFPAWADILRSIGRFEAQFNSKRLLDA